MELIDLLEHLDRSSAGHMAKERVLGVGTGLVTDPAEGMDPRKGREEADGYAWEARAGPGDREEAHQEGDPFRGHQKRLRIDD